MMSGSGTGPTITTLAVFTQYGSEELALDQHGDIFGVQPPNFYTAGGVFEIANTSTGYSNVVDVLESGTTTSDGVESGLFGSVVSDAAGDLFGIEPGGAFGDGAVYELVNHGTSGYYFQTIASFDGVDGTDPSSVILDDAGNLFGVTDNGSTNYNNVFEVAKTASGYANTPTVIYAGGTSFFVPINPLLIDSDGDLFGASLLSGVYELVNNGGGTYTFQTIAATGGYNALVADKAGNLFGVSSYGGAYGYGSVFEIAKTAGGYSSTPITLVNFYGGDGAYPVAVTIDAAGNLFGTTSSGGAFNNGQGDGTVFEIAKSAGGYNDFPTILVNFNGTNGYGPDSGLVADSSGDLFGSTAGLENFNATVFEVIDTGYQVSCFRQGTRIAVPGGARAVETLAMGEVVQTSSGALRPVMAMQHRALDCRSHPCPAEVWPVRVRAGAFAEGVPHRDVFLSPEHAVFFAGDLIPIRHLINDATITQERQDRVVYWHIELAQHDVVLAEGLPCETYLDTGNRDRASVAAQPLASGRTAAQAWAQDACAPLVETGARLAAARDHLAQRARVLGCPVAGSVDLPLAGPGWVRASIPADTDRVRLVCEAQRLGQDRRLLGALVSDIRLDGVRLGLDDARLIRGFHELECHDQAPLRWTDGAATLLLGPATHPRHLEVHVAAAAAA